MSTIAEIRVEAPVDKRDAVTRAFSDVNLRLKTPVHHDYYGSGLWRVASYSQASLDVLVSELCALGADSDGGTVRFRDQPSGTAIVLMSAGKPALVFSSRDAMRRYLRKRGALASRMYTMQEVPFDPQ